MAALLGMLLLLAVCAAVFAVIILLLVPIAFGGLWLQRHRDAEHAPVPAGRTTLVEASPLDEQLRAA